MKPKTPQVLKCPALDDDTIELINDERIEELISKMECMPDENKFNVLAYLLHYDLPNVGKLYTVARFKLLDTVIYHNKIAKILLERINIPTYNDILIKYAILSHDYETMEYFLVNGATKFLDDCVKIVCYNEFHQHCPDNIIQILGLLCRFGANVNCDDDICLVYAVKQNKPLICKFLMENGANVNCYNGKPIRLAVQNCKLNVLQTLFSFGADVKLCQSRDIFRCLINPYSPTQMRDTINLLLENGLDISMINCQILHEAVRKKNFASIKLFVKIGIDFSILTAPPDSESNEIIDLLLDNGADLSVLAKIFAKN